VHDLDYITNRSYNFVASVSVRMSVI